MITFKKNIFTLENKLFRRQLKSDALGLHTISVYDKKAKREYCRLDNAPEFGFKISGKGYSGCLENGNSFLPSGYEMRKVEHGGEELVMFYDLPDNGKVLVITRIYPDLAGCVRRIEFEAGKSELKIEDLFLETFNLAPGLSCDCRAYGTHGTVPLLPQFTITGGDDLLQFHDPKCNAGFFTGSSIPGPLRFVMAYPNWSSGIMYGYSREGMFTKYVNPGDCWSSDEVFLLLYEGEKDDCIPANSFRELVRRTLPELSSGAGFMLCTWIPFLKNIDQDLVEELSALCKALHIKTLVLDDGWFIDGKWQVDSEKFPGGLEKVSEAVHKNGVKFGIWFNIGTDYGAKESNPADNCTGASGAVKFLGNNAARCFASHHREHLVEKLRELAKTASADYFKMDFSNVISPYGVLERGCHSNAHAYHRNANDAAVEQYRGLYYVREALKESDPELALDYSFEVFGTEIPGIAGLEYSDFQHVSNLHVGKGIFYNARTVRGAIYSFTAMLPPERISGALIEAEGGGAEENVLTALAGNPLIAGDLRTLTAEQRKRIAHIASEYDKLASAGTLTEQQLFNSDVTLPYDQCDGYCRWSRVTGGGFAAIFANESGAASYKVSFAMAEPDKRYELRDMATGKKFGTFDGETLKSGIELKFGDRTYRSFTVKPC